MDLLYLEVDGSLANPFAAGAVAIWTALLSMATWRLARRYPIPAHSFIWAACLIVLLVVTRPAQFVIGNVLYQISDPGITSVGFWGGPPIWIATPIACVVALASSRRRRSE
jgi:hypothetical protein